MFKFSKKSKYFGLVTILFLSITLAKSQTTNEPLVDTLESQPVSIETLPTVDGEIVKTRLAGLQSTVPLKYNEFVHSFIDFFTYRKPSFTKSMLERKNYFFPIFEENLQKYGIPDEIKYLSLIESGLNPKAYSYAGAAGLWQFMPKTGRIDFGLRIDKHIDERYHVQKSTEAACKYMRQLFRIFGDWELVLAAYNTGPGNVKRAIRKAGGGGFWEIYPYLHKQTRSYVPQYVAMVYMMHYAADHNIFPENHAVIPPSSPVMVSNYVNLITLASLSNIPVAELKEVNPHILTGELPETTKDFLLSIPDSYYAYFDENKQFILDSASKRKASKTKIKVEQAPSEDTLLITEKKNKKNKETEADEELDNEAKVAINDTDAFEEVTKRKPTIKYHTIKRGENLGGIAEKYGVEIYDLKVWNKIKRSNDIKSGRRIKLYLENAPIKAEYFAKNSKKKEDKKAAQKQKEAQEIAETPSTHTVRKGENLFQIASKYDIEMDELKELNNIGKDGKIRFGQKLKLSGGASDRKVIAKISKKQVDEEKPTSNSKFHIVNKGDTIWSIVQRYEGTSVEKIRKLNSIKSNNLRPGQKLRLS
jgi:membrane-bound lytic murein transglycosylase D